MYIKKEKNSIGLKKYWKVFLKKEINNQQIILCVRGGGNRYS